MSLAITIFAFAMQWYQVFKISNFAEKNKKTIFDIRNTVFQFVRQDIQSSGYRGCRTQDQHFPLRRNFENVGIPYQFLKTDRAVFGFKAITGVCQQHIPQKFCSLIPKSSDVLVVYQVPQKIYLLKQSMINPEDPVLLEEGGRIQKNAMVLISDIERGDYFIANDVHNEKIFHQLGQNSSALLSKCYQKGTEVTALQTVAYYLAIPDRPQAQSGSYSLFRSDITQKAEEIVEGVVGFSVEYGFFEPSDMLLDGGSAALQYYPAEQIKPEQWVRVCMVRLKIAMKDEGYNGVSQKTHSAEYAFAIRNGHRVNIDARTAFSDLAYRRS